MSRPQWNETTESTVRAMNLGARDIRALSHVKRFFERYEADGKFRRSFRTDPEPTLRAHGLGVDPKEVNDWREAEHSLEESGDTEGGPAVRLYQEFQVGVRDRLSNQFRAHLKGNEAYLAWRGRQVGRARMELGIIEYSDIFHAVAAFELSKGCSVGCWFCGVSAARLQRNFEYTRGNAVLFREILKALTRTVGTVSRNSFCYWATEPFDNPHYERFLSDFYTVIGMHPSTTTALPMKDVARTRAMLRRTAEIGFWPDRFSIITSRVLDQLHQEFSPEELLGTPLVILTKDSLHEKTDAGRARDTRLRRERSSHGRKETENSQRQGSIACVSGFLFDMVERGVKLISPCRADDWWPQGYRVYEEARFETAADLEATLDGMIERHMPSAPDSGGRLAFHRMLEYQRLVDGFRLTGPYQRHTVCETPFTLALGDLIHAGNKTYDEVVAAMDGMGATDPENRGLIRKLFDRGFLDDEPRPSSAIDVPVEAVTALVSSN